MPGSTLRVLKDVNSGYYVYPTQAVRADRYCAAGDGLLAGYVLLLVAVATEGRKHYFLLYVLLLD